MTQYLKPKDEFEKNSNTIVIQPVTHEGTERFSLYDTTERKFYNEGDEVHIEGRSEPMECTRYIKLTDKEKNRYRRVLKVRRDVIYDGEEWVYDMPPSVDKELIKTMQTVETMDKNPLSFNYKIVRNKKGEKAWEVEYQVVVGEEVSGVPEPDVPDISLDDEEDDSPIELDSRERRYVEAIKKKYPDYAEKPADAWVKILVSKLSITDSRARKIVDEFLQ